MKTLHLFNIACRSFARGPLFPTLYSVDLAVLRVKTQFSAIVFKTLKIADLAKIRAVDGRSPPGNLRSGTPPMGLSEHANG